DRSAEELYRFWRDFNNLPTFMAHLASVQVTGDKQSHWVANGPGGKQVEWDAEIIDDQPNKYIAWRSLPGSDVDNSGSVSFERAPGGRGTLVKVQINYDPPGGALAAKVAKLFREEPGQKVQDDLRHFKQVMETGEVVKSDASIHRGMHAGQPAATAATA
ncbi:MAG: SRPBCC family protein, partial [Acidobacteriaceae bacterium]|nr:SRPBCC family protein [Acidobacteriaceae bacterium]